MILILILIVILTSPLCPLFLYAFPAWRLS